LAERRATELIDVLDLGPYRDQRCEGFSRGMKQKVALAGALIHDPKLIMLDEPLTGIDAAIARQVKGLLADFQLPTNSNWRLECSDSRVIPFRAPDSGRRGALMQTATPARDEACAF